MLAKASEPYLALARSLVMKAGLAVLGMVTSVVGAAGATTAQAEVVGSIAGIVVERGSGEGLVGATVIAVSAQTTRAEISDGNGRYRISGLARGRYTVTVYYGDSIARRVVRVSAGRMAPTAGFVIERSADWSGCILPGSPPPIAMEHTELAATVSNAARPHPWLRRLGDVFSVAGDGRAGVAGLLHRGLPVAAGELIQFTDRLELISAGAPARYGGRLGAIAEVEPRRGSNQSHGSVFLRGGADLLSAGIEVGGPMKRDHAWYYLGVAPLVAAGEAGVQMVSRVDWALSADHQGALASYSHPGASGASLHWRSRAGDGRKQIDSSVGWRGGAGDSIFMRTDLLMRKRAAGNHQLRTGIETIDARTSARSAALYVEDSWALSPSLTLNAGLRFERVAIRNAAERNVGDGGGGGGGGMCLASCDVAARVDGLAPRLGVAYDWTHEGRSRLFAHYGRYLHSVGLAAFAGDLVLPELEPAHVDELIAGVDYALSEVLLGSLSYTGRRRGRDLSEVVVDGTTVLANPGEVGSGVVSALEAALATASTPAMRARIGHRLAVVREVGALPAAVRSQEALAVAASYRGRDLTARGELTVVARGQSVFDSETAPPTDAQLSASYRTFSAGQHSLFAGARLRALTGGPVVVDLHLVYHLAMNCLTDDLDLYLTVLDASGSAPPEVDRGVNGGVRLRF